MSSDYGVLTQTALTRDCANGIESSLSVDDAGKEDQKNPLQSSASKMYGKILVKSLMQFKAEKDYFLLYVMNDFFKQKNISKLNYRSVARDLSYNYYRQL